MGSTSTLSAAADPRPAGQEWPRVCAIGNARTHTLTLARTAAVLAIVTSTAAIPAAHAQASGSKPRLLGEPQLYRLAPQDPDSDDYGAASYRYALVARVSRVIFGTPFAGEGQSAGDFSVLNAYPPNFAQATFEASNPQRECFVTYVDGDPTSTSQRALRSLGRRRVGQRVRVTLEFVARKKPLEYGPTYTRRPKLRLATYGFRSARDQRSLAEIGCARR